MLSATSTESPWSSWGEFTLAGRWKVLDTSEKACPAGVTPRSDWTPGISQGPSEDKVQLRAVTLLMEQTGRGRVDREGWGLNQGLLRMGGALDEWVGDCQESGLEAKRVRGVQVDHGEGTG